MRAQILQLLRENFGQYVSGEDLSRRLAVSRTAVWKHIRALKDEGYEVEGHSRLGYRLLSVPDLLLPGEIVPGIRTRWLGHAVYYCDEVDSTNSRAKKLAADGCPHGQIVIAETQTGGRGRLARGWFSPYARGIWLSVVLRPPFSPREAPKCTMLAAVAVNRAIRKVSGVACGIKWPNDILYDNRKIVGILTEMSAEIDAINYVVIGMGINVNSRAEEFPPELAKAATSLLIAGGRPVSRKELLAAVLGELEGLYDKTVLQGFAPVLEAWRAETVTLGRTVDVFSSGQTFSGLAVDIDDEGGLLVETSTGLERVIAGDVSVRARRGDK
ncbi:MAG TPA: biotin--[acetyl-CoA-carboxylase] ligase [Selenomonadales bacterium]|nr:biotin--[acetyl-CoA-carboxylase] ligase [Selenomonadales bacterium]